MENDVESLSLATKKVLEKITDLETKLLTLGSCPEVRRHWIPRHEVMDYLGFQNTQLSTITKKHKLTTTKIGKRIFYSSESLLKVLNQNQAK